MAVKVSVHIREQNARMWSGHHPLEMTRVPSVGEYVALSSSDADWYKVTLVVHCPYEGDYEAEVFAKPADHHEVMESSLDS